MRTILATLPVAAIAALWAVPALAATDICDQLGLSGLTISSDTNTLQISGQVAYEFDFGSCPYISAGLGTTMGGIVKYDHSGIVTNDDLDPGARFYFGAGARLLTTPIGVVNEEVQISHYTRLFTGETDDSLSTTNVLGRTILQLPITDTFSGYLGLGGGLMYLTENYPGGGSGFAPAFQLAAGGEYRAAPNIGITIEGSFTGPLIPIEDPSGYDVSTSDAAITAGIKFYLQSPKMSKTLN